MSQKNFSIFEKINIFLNRHVKWCLWLPFALMFLSLVIPSALNRYYCSDSTIGTGYVESYSVSTGRGGTTCHIKVFYQVDGLWYSGIVGVRNKEYSRIRSKRLESLEVPIKISKKDPNYISYY